MAHLDSGYRSQSWGRGGVLSCRVDTAWASVAPLFSESITSLARCFLEVAAGWGRGALLDEFGWLAQFSPGSSSGLKSDD